MEFRHYLMVFGGKKLVKIPNEEGQGLVAFNARRPSYCALQATDRRMSNPRQIAKTIVISGGAIIVHLNNIYSHILYGLWPKDQCRFWPDTRKRQLNAIRRLARR